MIRIKISKILAIILAVIISTSNLLAEDLTPEQTEFRDNIYEFLKEEGFMPTVNTKDNSVEFKKGDELHWISVGAGRPFYVEFYRSGFKLNDADRNVVLAAVNEANQSIRCAKAVMNETVITFAIEMYCHSAEEFRYVFYKSMEELENSENCVLSYYNEHSR